MFNVMRSLRLFLITAAIILSFGLIDNQAFAELASQAISEVVSKADISSVEALEKATPINAQEEEPEIQQDVQSIELKSGFLSSEDSVLSARVWRVEFGMHYAIEEVGRRHRFESKTPLYLRGGYHIFPMTLLFLGTEYHSRSSGEGMLNVQSHTYNNILQIRQMFDVKAERPLRLFFQLGTGFQLQKVNLRVGPTKEHHWGQPVGLLGFGFGVESLFGQSLVIGAEASLLSAWNRLERPVQRLGAFIGYSF